MRRTGTQGEDQTESNPMTLFSPAIRKFLSYAKPYRRLIAGATV